MPALLPVLAIVVGDATIDQSFQVLDRTFAILELFTPERPAWTISEVSRQCGLPVATAHRLLSALLQRGFLTREEETKRYRLGAAALRLGERARDSVDLRTVAPPVLRKLTQRTGETSLLTVVNESHDRAICLERVESAQPLRLSVQPGRLLPLHAGASEKLLLAYLREPDQERILAQPLERLERATITDPRALRRELECIRERGYALSIEETNAGVWGMAVPVLDAGGDIVAGIGFAGPMARQSEERAMEHLISLREAEAEVARALGLPTPGRS